MVKIVREIKPNILEIDPYVAEIAKTNVRKAELSAKIKVLVGDTFKIIPKLEGNFDLVFIDADKRQYLDYLRLKGICILTSASGLEVSVKL